MESFRLFLLSSLQPYCPLFNTPDENAPALCPLLTHAGALRFTTNSQNGG
jgi:hypothetical protein